MLRKFQEKRAAGEGGFTLVELLVVIVILGILAAVVVFAVGGITDKGKTNACAADKSALQAAEEAYFANANTSHYTDMAGLVTAKLIKADSTLNTIAPVGTGPNYTDYTVDNIATKCT